MHNTLLWGIGALSLRIRTRTGDTLTPTKIRVISSPEYGDTIKFFAYYEVEGLHLCLEYENTLGWYELTIDTSMDFITLFRLSWGLSVSDMPNHIEVSADTQKYRLVSLDYNHADAVIKGYSIEDDDIDASLHPIIDIGDGAFIVFVADSDELLVAEEKEDN